MLFVMSQPLLFLLVYSVPSETGFTPKTRPEVTGFLTPVIVPGDNGGSVEFNSLVFELTVAGACPVPVGPLTLVEFFI